MLWIQAAGEKMKSMVAVLGLSKFGRSLAEELAAGGAEVMVVDNNDVVVNQMSDKVTHAIVADLTDVEAIKSLGLGNMDVVVVAMSMNLEASIMSIMVAREDGAKKVIAKAKNDRMEEILLRIGADDVIQPEKEYGQRIAKTLTVSNFVEFFEITENLAIVELKPKASWVGKNLKELRLRNRFGVNVLCIKKDGKLSSDIDPDESLKEDQDLLILVDRTNLRQVVE